MPAFRHWFAARWTWLALAATGLWLHARELAGGHLIFRDVQTCYVPAKHYIASLLRGGELPQWWPWDAGGMPLLAQPQFSLFHPTTLFYLLLPFWTAFALQNLTGTLLALFGAYALARQLTVSRAGAFVAGVLYGASGYLVCLTEHQFMKLSAGTLPWYCWAILVATRRGGALRVLPAAVMGLLFLAGDAQIALLASTFGLALALATPREQRRRALGLAIMSPLAAVMLAAIQLLPSILILPETERGLPLRTPNRWHLEARHLWGLAFPIEHSADDFTLSTFVGVPGLALAAASLVRARRRPRVAALWCLAILSLWTALGDGYGLNALLRQIVPLWRSFRYPIKSSLVMYLALALLAGIGFTQLSHRRRRKPAFALAGGVGGVLLLGALLEPERGIAAWAAAAGTLANPNAGSGDVASAALLSMMMPWVTAAAVLAVTLAAAVERRGQGIAATLIACQVAASAFAVLPVVDDGFYALPPMARILRDEGVSLTGPYMDRYRPLTRVEGPVSLSLTGGGARTGYGAFFELPALSVYNSALSWRMLLLDDLDWDPARAGLFGVGYAMLPDEVLTAASGVVIDREPGIGYSLVKLRQSLPRAYAAHRARSAAGQAEALAMITAPAFKPGREIVVEGASNPDWAVRPDRFAEPVRFLSRTNATISLEARLSWPGFVVLNEAWFSGWQATVDGQPTRILIANSAVRAIEAPEGTHRVELSYTSPGFRVGAGISIATWLLLLATAARELLKRRQHVVVGLRQGG